MQARIFLPFRFTLLTTFFVLTFCSQSIGKSETQLLDSLNHAFLDASTADSARISELVAKIYRSYGDYPKSLQYAQMGYWLAEKEQDSLLLASFNNILGAIYLINNDLQRAYDYLLEAKNMYSQLGDTLWQLKILNNLALIHWKKNEFNEAKVQFHKIIEDTQKADAYSSQSVLTELRLVSYFNLGLMHYELKEHAKALEFLYKAESLLPEANNREDSVRLLQLCVRLAQVHFELKEFSEAEKQIEKGNEMALKRGTEEHMLRLMEVEISLLLHKGEWDKMIEKNREYDNLKKSYFDVERDKEMQFLNKRFDIELKNHEQEILRKELERRNLQRMFLMTALAFITIISFMLFYSLQQRKRANIALQKQTEELRNAKEFAEGASKAKEEFLSMMSHEIRTPLNGVIGITNILLQENPRPQQKENLDILKASANHLLALINDILDYNKIDSQNLRIEKIPFNLGESLDVMCRSLILEAKAKSLDFEWSFDADLPIGVIGDPVRINQVMNNLISNAIKFTNEGFVKFSVRRAGKDRFLFEVKDSGVGISPDHQKLVFERFTQSSSEISRKYGGTGLGLTISKKLVELMGGKLKLESGVGIGSTFSFELELQEENSIKSPNTASPNHRGALQDCSVLLAEDNLVNQLVARKFLENWGASLVIAANGKEAIERLSEKPYDLILMDIQMPEMDGLEATRLIRLLDDPQQANIPIVALTASVVNKEKDWIRKHGFDGFVFKPFKPEDLLNQITELWRAPGQVL